MTGFKINRSSAYPRYQRDDSTQHRSGDINLNPGVCPIVVKTPEVAGQYHAIGDALLACEAVSWKVGIPWLPPTKRVRSLRRHPEWREAKTLDDYLRCKLVGVKTEIIESYCEDLESLGTGAETSKALGIYLASGFERYLLADTTTSVTLFAAYFFFRWLLGRAIFSFVPALICCGLIGLVGTTISSEAYRRTSFYSLLLRELARRRGDIAGPSKTLKLYSAESI